MNINFEQIASVCHDANRRLQRIVGEEPSPPWAKCSDEMKQSAIDGVKFHIDALNEGKAMNGEEIHQKWVDFKIAQGWNYGPYKDEAEKKHPCIKHYSLLPMEQKMKDYLFAGTVRAFFVAARQNDDLQIFETTPTGEPNA